MDCARDCEAGNLEYASIGWFEDRLMWRLAPMCLLAFLNGCMSMAPRPTTYRAASPSSAEQLGIVFVANGSGDFRGLSRNLVQVATETCAPLQIETVEWSRGLGRVVADQTGHQNHLDQGRRLAVQVDTHRRTCPRQRIYLLGHSAGSAVVLAAAEALPENSVDRIVLLSPSVSATHDLRPALRASRCGIDVYYNELDLLVLGLCTTVVGTADHGCRTAAGREGFTPIICTPDDAALYGKLRQHPSQPAFQSADHYRGHYGDTLPAYLRAHILPLLLQGQ